MLRIFRSTRIRPPVKTASFFPLEPIRYTLGIPEPNNLQRSTHVRTGATKAGQDSKATTRAGVHDIEVGQTEGGKGKSAKVLGVESDGSDPKERRRHSTAAADNGESATSITQEAETTHAKRRRGRPAKVLEVESVKPEPTQRRRPRKEPSSDTVNSDLGPDVPPWKTRSWDYRNKDIKDSNSELANAERNQGKPNSTAASETKVYAEGGKKPKGNAPTPKSELVDNSSNEDSIENVGVKIVWSQKDLKKIATSPYLSRGTRLGDLDPVSRSLFEEYRKGEKKADYKRVNIVGSELCDDIIQRLKPTLSKHIGCDIIDINPGPGIWSAAIHNALKPRNHVLLEPDYSIYQPHLQPLLDADPSYKLLPKFGLAWNHLQRALSPEFLPNQIELDKDDPRIHEPNNTLLLIANVGYNPRKVYKGFSSIAQLFIHQLLSASRSNTLCHKYGRVRMLIWISDEERHLMNPRVMSNRRKNTMENEITCEYIEEIASSPVVHEHGYRDEYSKLESSINTVERMKTAGISTPAGRQSPMEIQAASGAKVPLDRNSISVIRGPDVELAQMEKRFADGEFTARLENPQQLTPGYNRTPEYYRLNVLERREKYSQKGFWESEEQIAELRELRAKLRSGEIQKYAIPKDQVVTRPKQSTSATYTPEYIRLRILRIRAKSDANRNVKHYGYMEEYDNILKLQEMARQPFATESMKAEAERCTALWKDMIFQIPHEQQFSYWLHHNNKVGFSNKPPILFWDRRRAEPLMVKANEFFPNHELALIDYQPKALWPSLQEDVENSWHVLQYLLDTMTSRPTQSLKDALLNFGAGCFEWIMAECPSLTDPSKGGNMDPDLVRVRVMTTEMWQEIYEAFQRWPYKPSKYELIRLMGFKEHMNDPAVGYAQRTE